MLGLVPNAQVVGFWKYRVKHDTWEIAGRNNAHTTHHHNTHTHVEKHMGTWKVHTQQPPPNNQSTIKGMGRTRSAGVGMIPELLPACSTLMTDLDLSRMVPIPLEHPSIASRTDWRGETPTQHHSTVTMAHRTTLDDDHTTEEECASVLMLRVRPIQWIPTRAIGGAARAFWVALPICAACFHRPKRILPVLEWTREGVNAGGKKPPSTAPNFSYLRFFWGMHTTQHTTQDNTCPVHVWSVKRAAAGGRRHISGTIWWACRVMHLGTHMSPYHSLEFSHASPFRFFCLFCSCLLCTCACARCNASRMVRTYYLSGTHPTPNCAPIFVSYCVVSDEWPSCVCWVWMCVCVTLTWFHLYACACGWCMCFKIITDRFAIGNSTSTQGCDNWKSYCGGNFDGTRNTHMDMDMHMHKWKRAKRAWARWGQVADRQVVWPLVAGYCFTTMAAWWIAYTCLCESLIWCESISVSVSVSMFQCHVGVCDSVCDEVLLPIWIISRIWALMPSGSPQLLLILGMPITVTLHRICKSGWGRRVRVKSVWTDEPATPVPSWRHVTRHTATLSKIGRDVISSQQIHICTRQQGRTSNDQWQAGLDQAGLDHEHQQSVLVLGRHVETSTLYSYMTWHDMVTLSLISLTRSFPHSLTLRFIAGMVVCFCVPCSMCDEIRNQSPFWWSWWLTYADWSCT